jgi:two-component system, cell cycle response regulator DivK
MKVLLVEDNELNSDMLSRRLQRHGCEVLLAADGESALAEAERSLPDIILMDISLPVWDGLEVTRRLKANPVTQHIPVIALTAHVFVEDRDRALAVGCVGFQTKPVDFPQLLDALAPYRTH